MSTILLLCMVYHTELKHKFNDMVPCVTVTVTERLRLPWFDGDYRVSRRHTRALKRLYRWSRLSANRLAWSITIEKTHALLIMKAQQY